MKRRINKRNRKGIMVKWGLPFYFYTLLLLSLTSCDELVAKFVDTDDINFISELKQEEKESTQVHTVKFSPDYKTFAITTRMYEDIGPYSLMDTNLVRISISETNDGIEKNRRSLPKLIGERNIKAENISRNGIKMLALIDATLPQMSLDRIRNYVKELRAVFNNNNLFVAFMQGDSISESMQATDYVLDQYFKKADATYVYLYRSILEKKGEMTSHQDPWTDAKKTVLLIFSNEKVYDDETDTPLDPYHYQLEEQMVDNSATSSFLASYASMKTTQETSESLESIVLRQFCENTHGIFMQTYSGTSFKNNILNTFQISPDANEFIFENPDGKVYRGNFETLTVKFIDTKTDSLITSFSTTICKGSIHNPIIVRGIGILTIIIRGFYLAAIITLIVWLLFQFVIPFIRYRYFLSKYVVRYTGGNMGFGTAMVQERCYLCKESFKTGEEIVVKCDHTMHRTCWDENEYHCPEYSDRCKHGSHYYNRHHLTDSRNASFYMKWIIMSIVAAWLAWMLFTVHFSFHSSYAISAASEQGANTPLSFVTLHEAIHSPLSTFGFFIGFFLTLGIALLSSSRSSSYTSALLHYCTPALLRALVAAVSCYLVFLASIIIVSITKSEFINILTEWIPWTLSGIIIAICGTYGTRIKLRKSLLLLGIAFGILTMYAWWLFFDSDIDYRVLLLFSFIIYSVGLTISVASVAPHSERYFLKVEGAVKTMDIALYKWFRNAPERVVTMGKSVDCSLQLSWDIMGDIAPVHAEIQMVRNVPCMIPLEEGVYSSGKPVAVGKKLWLHHGKSFTIGNTTFTYIEKDL